MGFAMRMNFVDVVVSDSLKNYCVDGKKTMSTMEIGRAS